MRECENKVTQRSSYFVLMDSGGNVIVHFCSDVGWAWLFEIRNYIVGLACWLARPLVLFAAMRAQ